ncbi:MAG TPA: hypothetical protein VHE55_18475 [Fimbriimonadaceae bacterium]|nr:hypothetical protein [Fimbriimonadaceae bacterium]
MMLAFVAIVLIVGWAQNGGSKRLVSHLPAPERPLSKPEPQKLLTESEPALSAAQRTAIQSIVQAWSNDKAKLLAAMSAYEPKQGRVDQMSASLEGYSQLSRDYDQARARYWSEALAVLDERQKAAVDGGSK